MCCDLGDRYGIPTNLVLCARWWIAILTLPIKGEDYFEEPAVHSYGKIIITLLKLCRSPQIFQYRSTQF